MPKKNSVKRKKHPLPAGEPFSTGAASRAFSLLLDYATKESPKVESKNYLTLGLGIAQSSEKVFEEVASFHKAISEIPYLALVMVWAESIRNDRVFGERYILMMKELLENDILPHRTLNLAQAAKIAPNSVYDAIRCWKPWSLEKREDYASLYCQFSDWASDITFGYFSKATDPDRQATLKRSLPYDAYVKILRELSDRDRILAKIFYLGGSRALEEVLSLQMKDINFSKNCLTFSQEHISYPRHVLEDIRDYAAGRKSGYLFLGRHGEKIDHTVPYRALKTALSRLGLDPAFTFKDFVKNQ